MKTIERRFKNIRDKKRNLADYPTLYLAVKGQCFAASSISRWFSILVSKDEYEPTDRRSLIKQLADASRKPTEDDDLEANITFYDGVKIKSI